MGLRGDIPVASKDLSITFVVNAFTQAAQNSKKKSPFLIGSSPILSWVNCDTAFLYSDDRGLKQTTSNG